VNEFLTVFGAVMPVFGLMGIGVLLRGRGWLAPAAEPSLLRLCINLLLPAGEFWFCRVFNKALPYITDLVLLEDVKGFVRQEAIHALLASLVRRRLTV